MPRAKKTFRNPNGYGTVYNLGEGRRKPWVAKVPISVEYTPTLKRGYRQIYKTLGYFETKEMALEALLEHKKGKSIKRNITFEQVYKNMTKLTFPSLGDEAQEKYKWAYNKFKTLHKQTFCDIGLFELQDVMDSYKDIGKESKQKIKSVLNAMYKYAIPRNIINTNYASYITINATKTDDEPLHTPFDESEIKLLWDNSSMKDIDTILIMIYMGYRPSEMLNIKTCDINIEHEYIKGGNKTNTGKNKIVPIPDKVLPFIKNRFNEHNEYLVCDEKGSSYSYDRYRVYIFNKIMEKLKLEHKPHDGRHTFATLISNVDENPTTIKKLIGHKNFKMTEDVYIHKNLDQLKNAINKI